MPDRYIARDSVELVGVCVTATTVAGTAVNPTGYTVTVAVAPENTTPVAGDFKAATWQTGSRGTYAVLLVGTGSAVGVLAAGNYRLWAKVAASPETPIVRSTDRLIVY